MSHKSTQGSGTALLDQQYEALVLNKDELLEPLAQALELQASFLHGRVLQEQEPHCTAFLGNVQEHYTANSD